MPMIFRTFALQPDSLTLIIDLTTQNAKHVTITSNRNDGSICVGESDRIKTETTRLPLIQKIEIAELTQGTKIYALNRSQLPAEVYIAGFVISAV